MDSNADGIGDFQGIIEKLDYIRGIGCNALWINPCFDSPFKDAGYDVRDYKKVAPRYGTNEDLYQLFEEAHKKGIHVLLDLVPGHTSEEHEWFVQSGKAQKNEFSERYVWTDHWIRGIEGRPYIGGECERNGVYLLNFFKCQPALNYGWKEPKENWQHGIDDPDCIATREAIKDVMRFWLSHGCDGFRVDMANSLVKGDDDQKSATCEVWRDILTVLNDFPEAAMVSEWSNPVQAICSAGFDMDFYLNHPGNGYSTLMRDYEGEGSGENRSYFKKDAGGDIARFLSEYLPRYEATKDQGYISLITCNHDTPRPSYDLSPKELALAYATILTLPGVPFIYYGDEIGMRYLAYLPTKEGGYTRTGTRTPMQWSSGKNAGFSEGAPEDLYLPVDSAEDAPTVEAQEKDENSLLQTVRRLTELRHARKDLRADESFEVLYQENGGAPFVYRRGQLILAVNPTGKTVSVKADELAGVSGKETPVFTIGEGCMADGVLHVGAQSFVVLAPQ